MKRFPFSMFPQGWFQLAYADELLGCTMLKVNAFGTTLLVFRGSNQKIIVIDAFDKEQYRWPTCEKNNMIFVYHHPDRCAPSYDIPDIVESSSKKWFPVGRLEWTMKSHVQEVVENAVDLGHFDCLHGFSNLPFLLEFKTHEHNYSVTIASNKLILGIPHSFELTIAYHGLGFGLGRVSKPFFFTNVVTCLPINSEQLRQRFTLFARMPAIPVLSPIIARVLRWHVRKDVEQEITVLNNKIYYEHPLLVKGDGPIMQLRRWCRQFYQHQSTALNNGI